MGDVVQDSVEAAQEQVRDHHAIFQLRPETHFLLVKGTNAVTPRGPFAHVATQMLLVMSIDLINPPTLVQASENRSLMPVLSPVCQQGLQLSCKEEWDKNCHRHGRCVESQPNHIYILLQHLLSQ